MKTIEEKNRMIAEFMRLVHPKVLHYHVTWAFLMPVVKKIREVINEQLSFEMYDDWRGKFKTIDPYNDTLEHCYEEAVRFIEWYNENK